MNRPPPWLMLAVGNPSRGDDALGPLLLERLRDAGIEAAGDVELLSDHQLQIENALDLQGRQAVLFVDAARSGTCAGFSLNPIVPDAVASPFTHALGAPALLEVTARVAGAAPPAWQLAIEGKSFGLGEALSPLASRHLEAAVDAAQDWLRQRRGADPAAGAP